MILIYIQFFLCSTYIFFLKNINVVFILLFHRLISWYLKITLFILFTISYVTWSTKNNIRYEIVQILHWTILKYKEPIIFWNKCITQMWQFFIVVVIEVIEDRKQLLVYKIDLIMAAVYLANYLICTQEYLDIFRHHKICIASKIGLIKNFKFTSHVYSEKLLDNIYIFRINEYCFNLWRQKRHKWIYFFLFFVGL